MARIFIIHATEDNLSFDKLTGQARTAKLKAEFDHMQAKQAWVPGWKGQCRTRIYNCDGAIVLISKHTSQGSVGWELECAQAFAFPMLGVYVDKPERGFVPEQLRDLNLIEWNWPEIARFIQSLTKGQSAFAQQ